MNSFLSIEERRYNERLHSENLDKGLVVSPFETKINLQGQESYTMF